MDTFLGFYTGFPREFARHYDLICTKLGAECETFRKTEPKVWKLIGDEIVFVNRVESQLQVVVFMRALVAALNSYKRTLRDKEVDLSIKAAAWICSFPSPNQTFDIRDLTKLGEQNVQSDETVEVRGDTTPRDCDFLGKGIDYGFRVAQSARPDFLATSPALAEILSDYNPQFKADGHDLKLRLEGTKVLKGVLDEEDYPVVGLCVEEDAQKAELRDMNLVANNNPAQTGEPVQTYLEKFITFHGIERPQLKMRPSDAAPPTPAFYSDTFVPEWNSKRTVETPSKAIASRGDAEADTGNVSLADLLRQLDEQD